MGLEFYKEGVAGAELPHPQIPIAVFLIVEKALCVAWDILRTHPRPDFNLLSAAEDVVTQELYEKLVDDVFKNSVVDGFNHQFFTAIAREPKLRNYDGKVLDKMPDMLIGLSGRINVFKPSQDWLFIECKPVDSDHPVGVHYCDKGIIRFVSGDYAWTMTNALMLGYVSNGYTISPNIYKALEKRKKEIPTIKPPCICQRSKPGKNNEVTHISEHSRAFRYVETGQQAPTITLRHLWLRRD